MNSFGLFLNAWLYCIMELVLSKYKNNSDHDAICIFSTKAFPCRGVHLSVKSRRDYEDSQQGCRAR